MEAYPINSCTNDHFFIRALSSGGGWHNRPSYVAIGSAALLLLLAAAAVAVLHAVLPDHWVPLAVVGRTQRWGPLRIARISGLAAGGHVIVSLLLAAIVAVIGLRFQALIDREERHIIGGLLIVTGLGFLVWGLVSPEHHEHDHPVAEGPRQGIPGDERALREPGRHGGLGRRLAGIVVPFGVAASPDLTILPVAFAAAGYGTGTVLGVLAVFTGVTMVVFVGLTMVGAFVGYQIKGEWLERHATTVTALVLVGVGVGAFVGL